MNEQIKSLLEKTNEEIEEKVATLRKIMLEAYDKAPVRLDITRKINEFGYYLENKYPGCFDYRLYRLLVGITPPEKGCSEFDFSGEDSVEKFIKSL